MFDGDAGPGAGAQVEDMDMAQAGFARQARLEELDRDIGEQAGNVAAALARMLVSVAEYDSLDGWHSHGARSLEEWLSWRAGFSGKLARDCAAVARRLDELPATRGAFERGEISLSKARAICAIAHPETDEMLVEWARSVTAADMDRIAATYNKIRSDEALLETDAKRERRECTYFTGSDGMMHLRARLMAEDGALVAQAIEQAAAADPDSPDEERSRWQSNADALVAVAERSLGADGTPPDRYLATIHVDLDVLTEASPDGRCEIVPGAGLHPETVKRLLCDAPMLSVIYKDGEPIDVGRKTRAVSTRLRRALEARDRTCRYPGCGRDARLDAHHVRHWIEGGPTELGNLCLLCRYHHRRLHEGRFTMERVGHEFVFKDSFGSVIPNAPPLQASADVAEQNRELSLKIDGQTIVPPHYYGEPMDMDAVIYVLDEQTRRAEATHS